MRSPAIGTCSYCGKVSYPDRSSAKKAAQQNHPGDTKLKPYRCGDNPFHPFHLGHQRLGSRDAYRN